MKRSSRISLALMATASASLATTTIPSAIASPAGDNVVISEVYGGGGNSGAELTNDFIELYNPTDQPITLDGWSVQYLSSKGTSSASTAALNGEIAPHGYYLIKAGKGSGGTVDFTADADGTGLNMSSSNGVAVLSDSTGQWTQGSDAVDIVGYGTTTVNETAPSAGLSNTTSAARDAVGTDTDNNAVDFTVGAPTPQFSGGDATQDDTTDPENPDTPEEPTTPGERVSIEDIQGTGAATPLAGQTVTTAGWVTASYPTGGFNGFTIQMGGTKETRKAGEASRAVFVYTGAGNAPADLGQCVVVTGKAVEYNESTQLSNPTFKSSANPQEDCGDGVEPNKGLIPTDPETKEANEHMLFAPESTYTVTNNYELNTYGSVDLVAGDEPLLQATSVVNPGAEAVAYEQENQRKVVTLDDGATANFLRNAEAKKSPLPYLTTADGEKALRTGDHLSFSNPVVLSYNFDKWGLQPTSQITGDSASAELPISWEDTRAAEIGGPDAVGGTHSIASFNVLNYFTDLGKDEDGCRAYEDMDGNPVTADYCQVRGAYTEEAFQDQQAKIVSAINTLDVSVLGLEEIENTAQFGGDRDESLNTLVTALNAAGGNWKAVPSPEVVPENEDVIRTAFIYREGAVEPVGESKIFDHEAFSNIARQPLAQRFKGVGADDDSAFVAVVNHYKSKGSIARGDADMGDGQGNNANLRAEMSRKLVEWLAAEEDFKDKPQFIIGDLNAYAKEDAVRILEDAGYTNIEDKFGAGHSYQFDGRLGSLDHVLANDKALEMTTGADVWDINSDESVAYEYSRRNYNVTDFYAPDPFRSSDHDPIKVGFNLVDGGTDPEDPENPLPETPGSSDEDSPLGSLANASSRNGFLGFVLGLVGLSSGVGLAFWWWLNSQR